MQHRNNRTFLPIVSDCLWLQLEPGGGKSRCQPFREGEEEEYIPDLQRHYTGLALHF